jgi:hypothetical protein
MSMSTQLHRGTLALPMLLLFAALALVANEELPAPKAPIQPAPVEAVALARSLAPAGHCALPRPGLLLGHAPADLASLAPRTAGSCRPAIAS